MTREQAYEKLELPVDTDLQVVRQKFQQMYNDFQMQIDGAFNVELKQRKEQQLEELKEAYAVLNESKGMDDSASLPRTEKMFDQTGNETKTQTSQQQSAPNEQQQAPPPPPPREKKEQPQGQTPPVYAALPAKQKSKAGLFIGIAAGVIVVLAGFYFLSNRAGTTDNNSAKLDSIAWESALAGGNATSYAHYLKQYPEGVFSQAAADSIQTYPEPEKEEPVSVPTKPKDETVNVTHSTSAENTTLKDTSPKAERQKASTAQRNWREEYDRIENVREGLSLVKKGNNYGFVDAQGKVVIPLKYNGAVSFSQGRALVVLDTENGSKWGHIDKSGKIITPIKYDDGSYFSSGLATVQLNGKWGAVNLNGELAIPLLYDELSSFSGNTSLAKKNGKYGLIDKNNNEKIPFILDDVRMPDGKLFYKMKGQWFNSNNEPIDAPD